MSEDPLAPTLAAPAVETELQAWSNQQALLVEVNSMLAGALDAEAVLEPILSRLRERTRVAHASIYRLIPDAQLLRCVAESGCSTPEANRTLSLDGPGVVAAAARAAESIYVPEVTRAPRYLSGNPEIQAEYAVPLRVGSHVLGVLDIESTQRDGIRAVTRKLVDQFAAQAALALDRSELDKKLRISEERFRSTFEQGQFGMALSNLRGEFSIVNPAFAQFLGYEPEELRGKHYTEVTHPDDRDQSLKRVESLRKGETTQCTLEKRYLTKRGEVLWGQVTVSLIQDAAGQPAYFLAMVEDITERKKAEAEWARLHEQLAEAQKSGTLGTLAGGIAHDFNNFLSVILGFASLVRLRLSPHDPLREPIRMIEQSAQDAADLTRELLGLARPGEPQKKPASVEEILDRVLKIVRGTFDRCLRVETRLAPALPWVLANPTQLEQAILNLCINARDAMLEGGTLTVETAGVTLGREDSLRPSRCPPGDYVRIAVKDTGVGMEPQTLPHLFEPFFTTKESGQGSGLGLTMVYGIVNNHGGFVHVESQLGKGTEFSLYLPAVPRPSELPAEEKPPRMELGSATVLVVDDEPMVRAFAEEGLRKLGYRVLTAENGARACELYTARGAEIDCVVLDLIMPEMSGQETYRRLLEVNPRVKVILTSGYGADRVARGLLKTGSAEFLGKPFTLEKLSLALKNLNKD